MRISENRHDFRQRYRTCVVKVFSEDKELLFYVDDISEDLEILTGSVVDHRGKGWIPKMFPTKDIDINFNWPELGTINIDNSAFRLSRIPRTQYRQSYCGSLISWSPVNISIYNILKIKKFTTNKLQEPSILQEVFYPNYCSFRTAITDLSIGKKYSVAISKDFYVSLSWNCSGIFLGYKDIILGKVINHNIFSPSVILFEGNEDFIEIINDQGIRIGGVE